jgi:hypothetical protein
MKSRASAVTEGSITRDRLARIRVAIRNRRVSFPSQVPAFARQCRPDVQWRAVALYFIQGWSCEQLAQRYGVTAGRIRQMIHKWVERATELGYLQRIPPQDMDVATAAASSLSVAQRDSRNTRVPTQDFAD